MEVFIHDAVKAGHYMLPLLLLNGLILCVF
jgi:hypothetical protein